MRRSNKRTARSQLLSLQKASYDLISEEILDRQTKESPEVKNYRRQYDREVKKYTKVSSKADLVAAVRETNIVYCGDFHTLKQAQRTPIKILRQVVKARPKISLGLEVVAKQQEGWANDFVLGKLSEREFLELIQYNERWGFPWANYRQLFDFAKVHRLHILGLNSTLGDHLPLTARDDLAADSILEATIRDADRLIFCLYGDLHIAGPHIPQRVDMRLAKHRIRRQSVTIFQNSDPIYWQLAKKGLEAQVDVVRIEKKRFCVLSAPPWTKWQSYLSWLEYQSSLLDDPEDPDYGQPPPKDYYHQVLVLAGRIAEFLGIKTPDLEHFSVFTSHDTMIIEEIRKYCLACHRNSFPLESLIRREIIENRSCFFPERSILFLNDLSEHRAAEKAGQLLASKLDPTGWVYGKAKSGKDIFYRQTLWEAIGYFSSKVINHKRKCDQYRDLERFLKEQEGKRLKGKLRDQREAIREVLTHHEYEVRRSKRGKVGGGPRKLFSLKTTQFFLAASYIGQILGERLFLRMIEEPVTNKEVRALYSPISPEANAGEKRYWSLMEFLGKPGKNQSKDDRF